MPQVPVRRTGVSAVVTLGRLATLAAALGVDLHGLTERLVLFRDELGRLALATVPTPFDRVEVSTVIAATPESMARLCSLADDLDPGQTARLVRLMGEARQVSVDLGTIPGQTGRITLAVQALGRRSLAADLSLVAEVSDTVAGEQASLAEIAALLGGDDHFVGLGDRVEADGQPAWSLHFRHRNGDPGRARLSRLCLDDAAAALGVTQTQRNLVADLHEVLAGGRDSYSWLRVGVGQVRRELGVVWSRVAWEHAVRMSLELSPRDDAPARLGALAGAAGTETTATVELALRPSDPPRMSITVDLGEAA